MYFLQLYLHNLYNLSEQAKKKIAPSERYEVLGEKKKNYRAPFSWIIGGLSYCTSPFVAFFKTVIDYRTRDISEADLTKAKDLLNSQTKHLPELLQAISTNYKISDFTSSTSKKLLINLQSVKTSKERFTNVIEFLDAPLAKGTKLQKKICHFITQWNSTSDTTKNGYQELTDGRRNSYPSMTG